MKTRNIFTLVTLIPLLLTALASCEKEEKPEEIVIEYLDSQRLANIESITIDNENVVKYVEGKLVPINVGETKATINNFDYIIKIIPATVDVVLFTGQSNMVGRDTEKYSVDNEAMKDRAWEYKYLPSSPSAVDGIYQGDPNGGKLVEVSNPTGETLATPKGDHGEISSGSNIVPQFCESYVKYGKRRIVAVHVARGGKQIDLFAPGGTLNDDIMRKYQGAINLVNKDTHLQVGRKFYIMLQGESDTSHGKTSQQYVEKYMEFHNSLKNTFGMEFGGVVQTSEDSIKNYQGILNIAQAKFELAMNHDDIIMASTEPLMYCQEHKDYLRSDGIHYTAPVMKQLGSSICETVMSFMGLKNNNLKDIEPATYLNRANHITSITLNGNVRMSVNASETLSVSFGVDKILYGLSQPECALLNWTSSDNNIATVDKTGKITAHKTGTVVITARSILDDVEGSITITIS